MVEDQLTLVLAKRSNRDCNDTCHTAEIPRDDIAGATGA